MLRTSEEYFEKSKTLAPGGVHSPVRSFKGMGRSPIFFTKAEGPYLWSVEGNRYIDFCQSFGPLILGHLDEEVKEEVHKMIDTAWSFGACEIYSLELADWITTHIPFAEKVRFVSSGTEAVMSALRVARAVTGKNKIVKFEGCYHGHVDSLLVQAGSGLAGESAASSAGITADTADQTIVLPLDNETLLETILTQRKDEIAAVIIEPLPANYGLLMQRKDFLLKLRELCTRNNILLIFDEVISGFRVALGGMAEVLDITPDLVTYGKIIGGGFPVGCYAGKKEYMDMVAPLGPVYQAGTLSANPVGMRAGLMTLQKMSRVNGWATINHNTQVWVKRISEKIKDTNWQMDSFSSLFWLREKTEKPIRSVAQIPKNQSEKFRKMFLYCLEQGVYLAPNAYEVGFLSLAHNEEILDVSEEILVRAMHCEA